MIPPLSHVHSQKILPTGKGRDRPPSSATKTDTGRSQTNWRGDKKCGKFGHLMYNCPDHQVKPALSGVRCDEVALCVKMVEIVANITTSSNPGSISHLGMVGRPKKFAQSWVSLAN